MATAEGERPTQIIIAASLLLLQGIWGLLRSIRCFRLATNVGAADVATWGMVFAVITLLLTILSIAAGVGLLRSRRAAWATGIVMAVAFLIVEVASERMIFGGAGIDIATVTSFLFTTSIVILLVLGRDGFRAIARPR